ncbi:hypothetical protein TNCT_300361 [Trichonephila clavata]|uniref:Uncharacterized protein n=1 Tax=Trichonephila clavata TaxID=2740835 RepID=A0A8X6I4E0_TRICU|nr:hypothetical protein TNCT_300361 [Trichonephila clavata]
MEIRALFLHLPQCSEHAVEIAVLPSFCKVKRCILFVSESDWAVDENHSVGNNKGGTGGRGGGSVGPPTIRRSSTLKRVSFPHMKDPARSLHIWWNL